MKSKRQVKNFFINPSFQLRFIGTTVVAIVLLTAVQVVCVELTFRKFESMGYSSGFPQDHAFFKFITEQRTAMFIYMSLATAFITLLASLFGYWYSHKIAGPLYRLSVSLKEMKAQRKLQPIKFRDNDLFQELPDQFNDLVEAMDQVRERSA